MKTQPGEIFISVGFKLKVEPEITKEDDWYIIADKITNVATQAKNKKQLMERFLEALTLYYEEFIPEISIARA
ncbi:MAG: type II toxin-antitoxin system HicB family antitoxin [DPANN group archaeon]|nr:type II toxin-antitoxin system HicB family antitoxin [DPANN group archaeon]